MALDNRFGSLQFFCDRVFRAFVKRSQDFLSQLRHLDVRGFLNDGQDHSGRLQISARVVWLAAAITMAHLFGKGVPLSHNPLIVSRNSLAERAPAISELLYALFSTKSAASLIGSTALRLQGPTRELSDAPQTSVLHISATGKGHSAANWVILGLKNTLCLLSAVESGTGR